MRKLNKSLFKKLMTQFSIDQKGRLYRNAGRHKGVVAGSRQSKGYRVTWFDGRIYYVHQLLFAVKHGRWPLMTDHRNRKRFDNRISNLKETTAQKNQENRTLSVKNKSGVSGVYFYCGKWRVQKRYKYVRYNLGAFDKKRDAVVKIQKFVEELRRLD